METLLTESMVSKFSSLGFVFWASTGKLSSDFFWTAGDFRQNGTQLVVDRISRLRSRPVAG
jgi:hypothetical protein